MKRAGIVLLMVLTLAGCKSSEKSSEKGPDTTTAAAEAEKELSWVSVVSTNDVHGYILPHRTYLPLAEDKLMEASIGGIEWLAGYLESLKKRDPVLLLDGGDMFQGTLISNTVNGASVVAAMNHLGYKAAAVGNHEFDFSSEPPDNPDKFSALKKRGQEARFPLLAANVIDKATGEMITWPGFRGTAIVEVGGYRIGLVGGVTETTAGITAHHVKEHLEFRPLAKTLEPLAKQLRTQDVDAVIALVHAGGRCEEYKDPTDLSTCEPDAEVFELARGVPKGTFDLIIGGHTHQIVAHRVNGTPIMMSWSKGTTFSLARLGFNSSTRKLEEVTLEGPVPVCHTFPKGLQTCVEIEDPIAGELVPATFLGREVKPVSFLDKVLTPALRKGLDKGREKLGAKGATPLCKEKESEGDHPIGLLETDALLDLFPQAQIALVNESGIRSCLPQGEITYADVFEVFPFDSRVAFMRLKGKELLDLLRIASSAAHGLPVLKGVRLTVDFKADECIREDWNGDGERQDFERNLLVSATLDDGSPIVPEQDYLVVTNTYLASGGSDFKEILGKLPKDRFSEPDPPAGIRDSFAAWLRKNPVELGGEDHPLDTSANPRVKILNRDHIIGSTCPNPPGN